MSSYIPRQHKRERDQISIKLDRDVLQKIEQYGRFLESSRDYIINSALELVLRKDKSFAVWLETEGTSGDAESLTPYSSREAEGAGSSLVCVSGLAPAGQWSSAPRTDRYNAGRREP